MIQVVIRQCAEGALAGKWDIHVRDRDMVGEILLFSRQGYENLGDAEAIVDRLFGEPDGTIVSTGAEAVDVMIVRADGTGSHRMIR